MAKMWYKQIYNSPSFLYTKHLKNLKLLGIKKEQFHNEHFPKSKHNLYYFVPFTISFHLLFLPIYYFFPFTVSIPFTISFHLLFLSIYYFFPFTISFHLLFLIYNSFHLLFLIYNSNCGFKALSLCIIYIL